VRCQNGAFASGDRSARQELVINEISSGDRPAFADLGLDATVTATLAALGYEEPTPIQAEAIPPLLAGRDLLGQAATGTGKTAAFALPILQMVAGAERTGNPLALVLVPTRELAVQVAEAVQRYGVSLRARVVAVYGGQPIGRQLQALKYGVDVVVATPGRAVDHLTRGSLVLDSLRTVVLDEADEMLDMGFADDLDAILSGAPTERQTVLFSATLPPRIAGLARRHLHDPVTIEIGRPVAEPGEAPRVRHTAHLVARVHKPAALARVLAVEAPTAALVFCKTRAEVDTLTEVLNGRGNRAEALHGGMGQEQRDRVMQRLRAGTANLLIATDVAARGLDVDVLTHVVNYDVPAAPETYVHRVGRVGRAGREGVAITLAEPRQRRLLDNIGRQTGMALTVAPVPSVADLRARRLAATADRVREALGTGADLDAYRPLLDLLANEADPDKVALAALALAHAAGGASAQDEQEIPSADARPRPDRGERPTGDRGTSYGKNRPGTPARGPRREGGGSFSTVFVGAGREAGVRPQDLVGAITATSSLKGKDIGAINLAERYAIVEVPERAVDEVITALRATTIRGKRPTVRRERFSR
jgi:ATP-dependent RNA helicase DeaD